MCRSILGSRLRELGIDGTALDWFPSDLTNRKQFVTFSGHTSSTSAVTQGVPQGSVLGPLLFTVYILPPGQILRHFKLDFHCYAEDPQIYPSTKSINAPPLTPLDTCLSEIKISPSHLSDLSFSPV